MKPKPEPTRQEVADTLRALRRIARRCDRNDRFERGMAAGYRLAAKIVRDYGPRL